MSPRLRSVAHALCSGAAAAWFAVPALMLVALVGAFLLAGVLREMPAPSGIDEVEVAAPTPPASGT